ncbi:hypothetical protein OF365_03190, partial [Ureaplasma zalophigenitalium]
KLEKLKNLKNTLLEKMFADEKHPFPKIRFKEFTNAWEQRRVGDLFIGLSGTSLEEFFNKNGKYHVVNIGSYGLDAQYFDQNIRIDKNYISKKYILEKNNLVMIMNDKTSLGKIIGSTLYIEENDRYIYNQRTQRLIVKIEEMLPKFAYFLTNSYYFKKKIHLIMQGTSQIYINWPQVEKILIRLAIDKNEQLNIETLAIKIIHTISLLQCKLENLQNIKNILHEKVLPGNKHLFTKTTFMPFNNFW